MKMKKQIGSLVLMAMIPAMVMTGCGTKSPISPVVTSSSATATPVSTAAPVGPTALNLGAGVTQSVGPFAVLAGSSIANMSEKVCGNIGLYEQGGTDNDSMGYPAVFTCTNNANYLQDTNGAAQAAQAAIFGANGAFNVGMALPSPTPIPSELGGLSIPPGFYDPNANGGFTLGTGSFSTVTLDNYGGNPNNVYIFVTYLDGPGTLTTMANTKIVLRNVKASNVFWVVGSNAAFGANSSFAGTVMVGSNITFGNGVTLEGNAYSAGSVVFGNNDTIVNP
jgi:hypothetical protein